MCVVLKLKLDNKGFAGVAKLWVEAVKGHTAQVAKGLSRELLNVILYTGPQYSGDFVANWNVSVGAPDYTFRPVNESVRYMRVQREGAPMAIGKSLARARVGNLWLGQTIWLANGAYHDESYAVLIENNQIKFRPENPSGGRVVARAIQRVGNKYGRIDRAAAMRLSMLGV